MTPVITGVVLYQLSYQANWEQFQFYARQRRFLICFACSKGGLVFVCGTVDGIIKVSGRRHNCDDLKATILAVDPIKFVYRGRLVMKLKYELRGLWCCVGGE